MQIRLFTTFISIVVLMFALTAFASADAPVLERVPGQMGQVVADGDQVINADGTTPALPTFKVQKNTTEGFTPNDDNGQSTSKDFSGRENLFGLGITDKLDSIIGADNRTRISPASAYPWRAIVHLAISFPNGASGGCSGSFVGPHTVLTAGHCIYSAAKGGWATQVVVTPGKDGGSNPYGSVTVGRSGMRSVTGWTNGENWRYDYAALVLPNNNMGNTVGWFGLTVIGNPTGVVANLSGYPGDKPYGTQWYASGTVTGYDNEIVRYTTDMASGHSGSGVYRLLNGARHIFGVNTYHDSRNPAVENFGRRINQAAFNNYVAWIN